MNALAILDKATQMLAEVRSVDDAIGIINLAEAARVYAKQVNLGLEAQNHAAEIKIRAQRKAGEILTKMEKGKGNQYAIYQPDKKQKMEQYQDIGITPVDASRWQQIAAVPDNEFEAFINETKDEEKELTTSAALRVAREHNKEKDPPSIPNGKYRIFYADPPWKYNSGDQHSKEAQATTLTTHYPSMTIQELCQLPVKNMAQDDAVLFMWTTSPLLEECFEVINAWGFSYKASIVWNKEAHNVGHYVSVRHEFLLICTKGSCTPDTDKLLPSVVSEKRTEHSVKPEIFREMIDTMYTNGKRIELFARRPADGWEVWGNDV